MAQNNLPAIQFVTRKLELTDAIRAAAEKKFARLERHARKIISIHLTLEVDKLRQIARAKLHLPGTEINAHTESSNLYESIDSLIDKLLSQLAKHHDKKGEHR